jgi:DNA polymerase-3 subunit gamma/tau
MAETANPQPALYRRYRPRRFSEVRGQEHITRALRNAVREGRVGHAYLFSGPRGTGKTSTARILAKVLNCAAPVDGEPCCECPSCLAVESGVIVDWLQELDAASNNRVDQMRDLLDRVPLGTSGTRKVYILDEVHMLTAGASNALLKTLEEPPEHVVFVLATTDPQKVLETIKSRTQHFEFRLLPADVLAEHVRWVIDDASLGLGEDAVEHVLRAGRGSARDALSALDQVSALGGVVEEAAPVDAVLDALADQSTGAALAAVAAAVTAGHDARTLGQALVVRLRDAFLSVMGAPNAELPEAAQAAAHDLGQRTGPALLTRALEVLGEALVEIRQAPDPRIVIEVALVRLTRPDADRSLDAVLERVERLERLVAAGGAGGGGGAGVGGGRAVSGASSDAPKRAGPGGARRERDPLEKTGGPGDEARAELAKHRKGGSRPTLGGVRRGASQQAAPPPDPPPAPSAPAAPPDDPTPAAGAAVPPPAATSTSPTGAPATAVPSRDELTLAWGDGLLGGLPVRVRSKWRGGRFVDSAGAVARFALPNEWHLRECAQGRPEVVAALTAHFGRPVEVELVLDETMLADPGAAAPGPQQPRPASASAAGAASSPVVDLADEAVDPNELVDAPDVATGVDKLLEVFPGSELLEEGS